MCKKIYILPETKIEKCIVLSNILEPSTDPNTNVNIGGEGGEDDLPGSGAKERGMEYGNIW